MTERAGRAGHLQRAGTRGRRKVLVPAAALGTAGKRGSNSVGTTQEANSQEARECTVSEERRMDVTKPLARVDTILELLWERPS